MGSRFFITVTPSGRRGAVDAARPGRPEAHHHQHPIPGLAQRLADHADIGRTGVMRRPPAARVGHGDVVIADRLVAHVAAQMQRPQEEAGRDQDEDQRHPRGRGDDQKNENCGRGGDHCEGNVEPRRKVAKEHRLFSHLCQRVFTTTPAVDATQTRMDNFI